MTNDEALHIAWALKDAREQLLVPDAFPSARAAFRQNVCATCKIADQLTKLVPAFDRVAFMTTAGLPVEATASSEWSVLYPQTEG